MYKHLYKFDLGLRNKTLCWGLCGLAQGWPKAVCPRAFGHPRASQHTHRRTDGRTDGRTDATKYIISLASRSIIISYLPTNPSRSFIRGVSLDMFRNVYCCMGMQPVCGHCNFRPPKNSEPPSLHDQMKNPNYYDFWSRHLKILITNDWWQNNLQRMCSGSIDNMPILTHRAHLRNIWD